jgi:hypothetical protein
MRFVTMSGITLGDCDDGSQDSGRFEGSGARWQAASDAPGEREAGGGVADDPQAATIRVSAAKAAKVVRVTRTA